jgi:sRNA-binding carbon storage regulator CsrA
MLGLGRREGQRIYLRDEATGEEIILAFGKVEGGWVKVYIQAQKRWHILRGELDPKRNNLPEASQ